MENLGEGLRAVVQSSREDQNEVRPSDRKHAYARENLPEDLKSPGSVTHFQESLSRGMCHTSDLLRALRAIFKLLSCCAPCELYEQYTRTTGVMSKKSVGPDSIGVSYKLR